MTRLIIIAGVTAILCAGAVSGAQAQAPLQPPGVGQPGHPGGAEMRGPRMNGPGARGPDQRGGRRGGLGGPLTPAERQARVAALFTRMDATTVIDTFLRYPTVRRFLFETEQGQELAPEIFYLPVIGLKHRFENAIETPLKKRIENAMVHTSAVERFVHRGLAEAGKTQAGTLAEA
jgi:hypothetical protein